jgi:hypothetical protein
VSLSGSQGTPAPDPGHANGNGATNNTNIPNGHDAGARRPASLTLVPKTQEKLSTRDFKSDQEVRWCPPGPVLAGGDTWQIR